MMSNLLTLNELTRLIQDQFQDAPPNGWLLGWDERRLFSVVCDDVRPYIAVNETSFDYGFCNWYDILIAGEGDVRHWVVTVKLSFIVPAYCIYWAGYNSEKHGAVTKLPPERVNVVKEKISSSLDRVGFFELPDEWYGMMINGVNLELSGSENVTIGKCLFSDYEG